MKDEETGGRRAGIEQHDEQEGYCPMLGHFLKFSYCRTMKEGQPCGRILNCWFQTIEIEAFITRNYSAEEQQKILEPPKPKFNTLVDLIAAAQKRNRENG